VEYLNREEYQVLLVNPLTTHSRPLTNNDYLKTDPKDALRQYRMAKAELAPRIGRFGIVNNRIFLGDGELLVPYIVGEATVLHRVRDGETEVVGPHRLPQGAIFTDALHGRTTPDGHSDGTGMDDAQREAVASCLGMSYAELDVAWAQWVAEAYSAQ